MQIIVTHGNWAKHELNFVEFDVDLNLKDQSVKHPLGIKIALKNPLTVRLVYGRYNT